MVDFVNREAYREQLHRLLPSGRAWRQDRESVLTDLLDGIAQQLSDIDLSGAAMLNEVRPSTTLSLLPDWERVAGLPDDCSNLGSTVTIRKASLITKLVSQPTLNIENFREIGRTYGVTLTITELDQVRADASTTLDTTNGKWRFVWWIEIPATSDIERFKHVKSRQHTIIECGTEYGIRVSFDKSRASAYTIDHRVRLNNETRI